jgi:hypothetical protein
MNFKLSPNSPHIQIKSDAPISPALPPQKTIPELLEENAALRKEVGKTLEPNDGNFFRVATKILREEFNIPAGRITLDARIIEDLELKGSRLRSFLHFLEIEFSRKFNVPKSGTLGGFFG